MVVDDANFGFESVYAYDNDTDTTHGGEPVSMGVGEATTTRSELAVTVPGESCLYNTYYS